MIENIQIYQWLKRYGYLPGVKLNELDKLDNASIDLQSAAEKMQLMYGYEILGQPDSVIGPRTLTAMLQPRCGHPDFADAEIANRELDDIAELEFADCNVKDIVMLQSAHQRMLQSAIGRGSWPQPCQKNGVKVYVDRRNAPKSLDVDRLIEVVFVAYARLGLRLVLVDSKSEGNIDVEWRGLRGSVIGLAEFNNQTCTDSVFCYLDPSFNPSFAMVAELLCHEWGHNNNLQHTRGGIMNPTIERINLFEGWKTTDPSYNTLVRYFGGEPIDVTPTPNPPSPNPPTGDLHGVLVVDGVVYNMTGKRV